MSDSKKQKFSNVGASSILMIFIILCLTVFGLLSLISAKAELRLSEKSKESVEEFYAADAEVERIIKEIDDILFEARQTMSFSSTMIEDTQGEYERLVSEKINSLSDESALKEYMIEEAEGQTIAFNVPVTEDGNKYIEAKVKILPLNEDVRYKVITRRTVANMIVDEGIDDDDGYALPPDYQ